MTILGNYELLTRLATGGMAEAHVARSLIDGSVAVIKQLLPKYIGNPEFVEMFLDEGRVISSLHHPNVVGMKEFGFHDELPYLAMEYLHGVDLRTLTRTHWLRRKQLLPLDVVVYILEAMLAGLHHAHEARAIDGRPMDITHRDVSPQNVVIMFDGQVKLIDFGIAKARGKSNETRSGALKGKIPYMSPEQVRAASIDRRTDIYAAGIVLYELAVGRRPYVGKKSQMSEFTLMMAIANHRLVAPRVVKTQLPEALDKVIMRALAADPARRYQTAEEMREALHAVAAELAMFGTPGRVAEVMASVLGDRKPDAAALRTNAGVVKMVTDLEQSKTTVDERLDPDLVDPSEVGLAVASTDKDAHEAAARATPQGAPELAGTGGSSQRYAIVDKVVEANVTRLKFQRSIDATFRWGKLLDGVEGIVEIDFTNAELTGPSISAALEALKTVGGEVSELRLVAAPISLASQLDDRYTVVSVTCRGRCSQCAIRQYSVVGYDEINDKLADGGSIPCPRCGTALTDIELSPALNLSRTLPVPSGRPATAATSTDGSVERPPVEPRKSSPRAAMYVGAVTAAVALGGGLLMWKIRGSKQPRSQPVDLSTGRIWQEGDRWVIEAEGLGTADGVATASAKLHATRAVIAKLEAQLPDKLKAWSGSASDGEAVANFQAQAVAVVLEQRRVALDKRGDASHVSAQFAVATADLERARAFYAETRTAWGIELANAPPTRSPGVIVVAAPPGPIAAGDRVVSIGGQPISTLSSLTTELSARSQVDLIVEHREQHTFRVGSH